MQSYNYTKNKFNLLTSVVIKIDELKERFNSTKTQAIVRVNNLVDKLVVKVKEACIIAALSVSALIIVMANGVIVSNGSIYFDPSKVITPVIYALIVTLMFGTVVSLIEEHKCK